MQYVPRERELDTSIIEPSANESSNMNDFRRLTCYYLQCKIVTRTKRDSGRTDSFKHGNAVLYALKCECCVREVTRVCRSI